MCGERGAEHRAIRGACRLQLVDKATNKLLRDVPMELYRAGAGRIAGGVPIQYGGVNSRYQEPGRYMVTTTYRRPDPQQPEHWLVDTSTLTFEISEIDK